MIVILALGAVIATVLVVAACMRSSQISNKEIDLDDFPGLDVRSGSAHGSK